MAERRTPVSPGWSYSPIHGAALFECPDCAAVVISREKHVVWHQLVAAAVDSLPEERR